MLDVNPRRRGRHGPNQLHYVARQKIWLLHPLHPACGHLGYHLLSAALQCARAGGPPPLPLPNPMTTPCRAIANKHHDATRRPSSDCCRAQGALHVSLRDSVSNGPTRRSMYSRYHLIPRHERMRVHGKQQRASEKPRHGSSASRCAAGGGAAFANATSTSWYADESGGRPATANDNLSISPKPGFLFSARRLLSTSFRRAGSFLRRCIRGRGFGKANRLSTKRARKLRIPTTSTLKRNGRDLSHDFFFFDMEPESLSKASQTASKDAAANSHHGGNGDGNKSTVPHRDSRARGCVSLNRTEAFRFSGVFGGVRGAEIGSSAAGRSCYSLSRR
ncbi:hypothetical protein BKA81DRAFT_156568 [Phyllosticta paracitricarpa]